ncbi:MAG TPA: T9SS type A sorting domain-containing protein, partial [Saprospiraceae bacterium]|nr:T9SS type A sorting domain-containing protein [Saprospiraceae bacterium]
LVTSTAQNPNPKKFFGADQLLNGRLRDLAVSPDGKKIYLVNNFGDVLDHITVYTYQPTATHSVNTDQLFVLYPNPTQDILHVQSNENIESLEVYTIMGQQTIANQLYTDNVDISRLNPGMYFLKIKSEFNSPVIKSFVKL